MRLGDQIKEFCPGFKELTSLCAMMTFSLVLFRLGQFNIWVFVFCLFALPLVIIYLLEIALFYFLGINRSVTTNISNRFITALLLVIATVYNLKVFTYDITTFIFVSAVAIVGQGIINHIIRIIRNRSKKNNVVEDSIANNKNIHRGIVNLFIRNIAFTIIVIGILQQLTCPTNDSDLLLFDVSNLLWAERLFSMSCSLWVIAASAYFLGLNREVLTSKRVQATMAAIFLICGLATTLLFNNASLAYSALAAPLIYLILQNRFSSCESPE